MGVTGTRFTLLSDQCVYASLRFGIDLNRLCGGHQKRRWFSGGVLGWSWEALGVVLEVWGPPWVSPGRSTCCYFVGFRWFSEMSCFLMFFHRYLKAM